jgi:hypothetical protein
MTSPTASTSASTTPKRSRWLTALAIFVILFGLLTIMSGGSALFNAKAQALAGDVIEFVLWFNFLAGFAYVIAGAGLLAAQRWALWLSIAIAGATLIVFAAFALQVWSGRSYEMRTVGAMGFRTLVWIITSIVAYRSPRT